VTIAGGCACAVPASRKAAPSDSAPRTNLQLETIILDPVVLSGEVVFVLRHLWIIITNRRRKWNRADFSSPGAARLGIRIGSVGIADAWL
jgi:hypothetical protein